MDQRGAARRRALGLIWAVVFGATLVAVVSQSRPVIEDLPAAAAFTAGVGLLAYWSKLRGSRVEYEPNTPLVMASALAVSPGTAPALLFTQAVVLTLIDWRSHRRSGWHMSINAGVFALWHGALGLIVLRSGLSVMPSASVEFAVSLMLVAALVVMLNNLTVAATTAYLYGGRLDKLDLGLGDQARDVVLSVVLGLTIRRIPGPDWLETAVFVGVLLYGLWYFNRYREHRAALVIEAQARIVVAEADGPLPGHTARVVDAVRRLSGLHGAPADLADLVAWTHSLHIHPRSHLCSGIEVPPYTRAALWSVPGMYRARRLQPVDGLPGNNAQPITQIVAAACAWDSRALPGSPVRTPADLVYTFGINPEVVDQVVGLDPSWVTRPVRAPADGSKPR